MNLLYLPIKMKIEVNKLFTFWTFDFTRTNTNFAIAMRTFNHINILFQSVLSSLQSESERKGMKKQNKFLTKEQVINIYFTSIIFVTVIKILHMLADFLAGC